MIFIDPYGKDIIPFYYRDINRDGGIIPNKYRSHVSYVKAMNNFSKTTYDSNLISSFTKKSSSMYGVKGNGKF